MKARVKDKGENSQPVEDARQDRLCQAGQKATVRGAELAEWVAMLMLLAILLVS